MGELSYPLYLSHEMIASLVPGGGRGASIGQLNARALTVLVVAIIVSGLAARFVEIPIDRFRQARLGKRSEERVRG